MLKESGYGGERIVLMNPTDQPGYSLMAQVADAAFRQVGLNIDMQSTDWGTVTQRRTSKEPLDKGGWSLFPTGQPAADYGNPVLATSLRCNGKSAFFGWPENPRLEELRQQWIDSSDQAMRRKLAEDIQREAMSFVPMIPLGQYIPATGYRSNISGILHGPAAVFWNVEKA
jgi:peptide/nickel transport system substrate-binding protein